MVTGRVAVFSRVSLLAACVLASVALWPGGAMAQALADVKTPDTPLVLKAQGRADNVRAVRNFRKMTAEESADVRKRAVAGAGVYTGTMLEYWKKKA